MKMTMANDQVRGFWESMVCFERGRFLELDSGTIEPNGKVCLARAKALLGYKYLW